MVARGKPMPDFTLPSYQGADVTLSKLRGTTVILVDPEGIVQLKYFSQNSSTGPASSTWRRS